MESKQNQLYRFHRGDSNLYNRGHIHYDYNNFLNSNIELPNNYRNKQGIYFNSIDPAYLKCKAFCDGCNVLYSGMQNTTINILNCQKCKECLTPMPEIYLKPSPLPTKKYPRYPKEAPQIPTPFPYLKGSHNVIPHIIPLKKDEITSRRLNAVSTSNIGCDDYCGKRVCDEWRMQMNLYNECQIANSNDLECKMQFGCKQWKDNHFRLTPPIPPHLTDCESCWMNGYTNI